MNIFEIATRHKYRFVFKGYISCEDAWDLSVDDLDTIFKALNAEKKTTNEESLLTVKTKENEELNIKIEIIKHIVSVKLEDEKARVKGVERKQQKEKILHILAKKQDESLENKPMEELIQMLDSL